MGINIEYMPFSDVQRQPQAWQDRVLGVVNFGETHPAVPNQHIPAIHLNAPVLAGERIACEVWLSDTANNSNNNQVVNGRQGEIQYRTDSELLFGVINLDELVFSQGESANGVSPLQQATESAYQQIFALIDALGYPHLYRFWNYLADINETSHGLERYRHFNVGRKQVLVNSNRIAGNELPAACALGLSQGPLSIAFLVGKAPAIAIENPRQMKAYDYPEQYGPRTPSFSRATLLKSNEQTTLFISGTASIVGHETLHIVDIAAQTRETLANLEAVIKEANRVSKTELKLHVSFLRVYIRNEKDLAVAQAELQKYFNGEIKATFVQADICRSDLLIEIETTIQLETQ
jgi:chorismate lyase/3-hydroxybenzoate synthase